MSRPLVVVTREADAGEALSRAIEGHGFRAWHVPTIVTAPPDNFDELDAALVGLPRADWLVFTSPRAVAVIGRRADWRRVARASSGRIGIAAVGEATAVAVVEHLGLRPLAIAAGKGSSDLLRAMTSTGRRLAGAQIVWPHADRAVSDWTTEARRAGATVTSAVAYRLVPVPVDSLTPLAATVRAGGVVAVTFCSPSSAQSLARVFPDGRLDQLAAHSVVAALGATTAAALRDLGAPAAVVAPTASLQQLADALATHLSAVEGGRG